MHPADIRHLLQTPGELEKALDRGMAPDHTSVNGSTLVQTAAEAGNCDAIRTLIARGADVNAAGALQRTALQRAVIGGHTDVCRVLLAAGADPNQSYDRNDLPLLQAIVRRHVAIVELLVSQGADPRRIVAASGTATALDLAEDTGDPAIVAIISKAAGKLPDRSACKCHRLPRSDLFGALGQEKCLEKISDAGIGPSGVRRLYPRYRCRETGLIWQVEGYDERGRDNWAFTLDADSIGRFFDLLDRGRIVAAAGYVRAQRRRLDQ